MLYEIDEFTFLPSFQHFIYAVRDEFNKQKFFFPF